MTLKPPKYSKFVNDKFANTARLNTNYIPLL